MHRRRGHDGGKIFVMHDIKWIRDNPDAFDRGAGAARACRGEAKRLIALDERRRAAIQKAEAAQARRNAASKEIGAGQEEQGRGAGAGADGRGRASSRTRSRRWKRRRKRPTRNCDKALAEIPNLPLDDVPDGADEDDNVEHHHFGARSATTRSRRSSISSWAKRSARWISRPRRNSPARASSC